MRRMRRLIVLACIVVLLAAALFAPASGGSTPAVLVALDPLFGLVVLPAPLPDDTTPGYAYLAAGPGPSRAPPAIAL